MTWTLNQRVMPTITQSLGDMPIMIKSRNCHLSKMSPAELVKHGELVNETGGYFIINGGCRILRLLTANRRNYPLTMIRESWKHRDAGFTDKGVLMRCVKEDQYATDDIIIQNDNAKVDFVLKSDYLYALLVLCSAIFVHSIGEKKSFDFFLPYNTKILYEVEEVKNSLSDDTFHESCLCEERCSELYHMRCHRSVWYLSKNVCVDLLVHFINGHQMPTGGRRPAFNHIGFICNLIVTIAAVRESLDGATHDNNTLDTTASGHLTSVYLAREPVIPGQTNAHLHHSTPICIKKISVGDVDMKKSVGRSKKIGQIFQTFLATGTLVSKTGCGLMQTQGLTVILEHLNRMRDMSHLRAIHRGAHFVEMKTIAPRPSAGRRFKSECFGFICPVHTPDGAPCGLLNHLAQNCFVLDHEPQNPRQLQNALVKLGMTGLSTMPLVPYDQYLEVILDGRLVGYILRTETKQFTHRLRIMKVQEEIFKYTEIIPIEKRKYGSQYPALFLVTSVSRMMRPVINLDTKSIEFIGTLEQNFLNVAVSPEQIEDGILNHKDLSKSNLVKEIGSVVDCTANHSNVHRYQMGKQTMGTPLHNWRNQTSNKIYRLQYPQVPLVRNSHYDDINMEEFCMGFNACVAIVSYTGYDMEDAMVINKCAMERGLAHGQVYKSEFVDLSMLQGKKFRGSVQVTHIFRRDPSSANQAAFLDESGLPYPGTKIKEGEPYYCVYDINQQTYRLTKYKGEDCVVDKYTIMSANMNPAECQRVCIVIRITRNPIVGDKFASRSGQKGIMSRLYPVEDMPFSERGVMPDIIFNPHGIPSRMTAGKLIELISGKCAAEFGLSFDSTPFQFSDENPAVDYFGKILEKGGYNYYGEDVLYSGTDGRMMEVKIFQGIIYYQRLRHMTADKWQVRETGINDMVTRQPIKGRKRGGAIRFGEMERDCLISHGAVYTLKDRLLDCSDDSVEWVCETCGSILSPNVVLKEGSKHYGGKVPECRVCESQGKMRQLHMPYAFKYLVAELASVGIKTQLGIKSPELLTRPMVNQIYEEE
ncbi:unnamed protein product, partial [Meganyctiphanes norvegica]